MFLSNDLLTNHKLNNFLTTGSEAAIIFSLVSSRFAEYVYEYMKKIIPTKCFLTQWHKCI